MTNQTLAVVLAAMGAITSTVGNTAAYAQKNLKRLLAYSSIAHAGYMLCGVLVASRLGAKATRALQDLMGHVAPGLRKYIGAALAETGAAHDAVQAAVVGKVVIDVT